MFKLILQFLFLIIVLSGLVSCSCEKEKRFSKTEMLSVGQKVDPNMKDILGQDMTDVPAYCKDQGSIPRDYIVECLRSYRVRVYLVTMIAVEFSNHAQACKVAESIDQYCWFNWLFDDVVGEPVLERFVEEVYKAKRPKKSQDIN